MKYMQSYSEFNTSILERDLVSAFDQPSEFDNGVDLCEVSDHSMDVSVDIETVKNQAIKRIKKRVKKTQNNNTDDAELFSEDE